MNQSVPERDGRGLNFLIIGAIKVEINVFTPLHGKPEKLFTATPDVLLPLTQLGKEREKRGKSAYLFHKFAVTAWGK